MIVKETVLYKHWTVQWDEKTLERREQLAGVARIAQSRASVQLAAAKTFGSVLRTSVYIQCTLTVTTVVGLTILSVSRGSVHNDYRWLNVSLVKLFKIGSRVMKQSLAYWSSSRWHFGSAEWYRTSFFRSVIWMLSLCKTSQGSVHTLRLIEYRSVGELRRYEKGSVAKSNLTFFTNGTPVFWVSLPD